MIKVLIFVSLVVTFSSFGSRLSKIFSHLTILKRIFPAIRSFLLIDSDILVV